MLDHTHIARTRLAYSCIGHMTYDIYIHQEILLLNPLVWGSLTVAEIKHAIVKKIEPDLRKGQ